MLVRPQFTRQVCLEAVPVLAQQNLTYSTPYAYEFPDTSPRLPGTYLVNSFVSSDLRCATSPSFLVRGTFLLIRPPLLGFEPISCVDFHLS